jgi:hypothetical protein|tara:strand:+ start:15576 stop:15809 length:234 start_codon:yes stop_codon:yes gene_type:complete
MKNLGRLFWQLIIGKGISLVDDDTYKYRIDKCRSNICGVYKKPFGIGFLEKCGDCGCNLRTKNRINEWYIKCPKNWW